MIGMLPIRIDCFLAFGTYQHDMRVSRRIARTVSTSANIYHARYFVLERLHFPKCTLNFLGLDTRFPPKKRDMYVHFSLARPIAGVHSFHQHSFPRLADLS